MGFNLDTGILIGLVSTRLNPRAPWYFSWASALPFTEREQVGACRSVHREFERIILFGNKEEQANARRLYQRLALLEDHDDVTIPLSRKIQAVDRIFVSTGRTNGLINVTTDAKLVRALRDPSIIVLPPKPLAT